MDASPLAISMLVAHAALLAVGCLNMYMLFRVLKIVDKLFREIGLYASKTRTSKI